MIHGDIEAAGKSDMGRVRDQNEDRYGVTTLHPAESPARAALLPQPFDGVGPGDGVEMPRLLVVADGVGGAPGGHVASGTAVFTLIEHMRRAARAEASYEPDSELLKAAEHAGASVAELCASYPRLSRMSTTLTAALVRRNHLNVVHAGDSRCYVMRRGEAPVQITHDHTLAQWQVDVGILAEGDPGCSRLSHVLTNAVGGGAGAEATFDLSDCALREGDSVLVCSDGLTRHLSDDRIAQIVAAHHSADMACEALVAEAKALGGEDNITALLAFLRNKSPEPPAPAHAAYSGHASAPRLAGVS